MESRGIIDVVLPVLDEAQAIPGVLASLPGGYRPIVVDNGSADGSAAIARDHGATVVGEPTPGFGSACFAGLTAARSEVVCFMDCDGSSTAASCLASPSRSPRAPPISSWEVVRPSPARGRCTPASRTARSA